MTTFNNIFKEILDLNDLSEFYGKADIFEKLKDELIEANEKFNLTAVKDDVGVAGLHFADSLLATKYVSGAKTILDIGTGAGFPSLPLAIVLPETKVTAIDSTAKKVGFSSAFADKNGITNFISKAARAEEMIAKEGREKYDAVTARAVARLNILSELCLPYAKIGGKFIALKGSAGEEELKEAEAGIKKLGGEVEEVIKSELILPEEKQQRTIIIIKKVSKTPEIYPRQYAKIVKKPLA